jgi:hypothetical protein
VAQDETPKVVGGKLDRPYPIKTMGDVSRARVLPPPRVEAPAKPAAPAAAAPKPPAREPETGMRGYVKRRNALIGGTKPIKGRAPIQRSLTRRV